jgi:hypothetical protein
MWAMGSSGKFFCGHVALALILAFSLGLGLLAGLQFLFDEMQQTVDQAALAANHVQPALVLMLGQNPVQVTL